MDSQNAVAVAIGNGHLNPNEYSDHSKPNTTYSSAANTPESQSSMAVTVTPDPTSSANAVSLPHKSHTHSPYPTTTQNGLALHLQQPLKPTKDVTTRDPPSPTRLQSEFGSSRTAGYEVADRQPVESKENNGPRPIPGARSPPKTALGYKRTATGDIKSSNTTEALPSPDVNVSERLRSRSIGAVSRDSRIAALSVHLRTRLSYAAAQIEKSRQSHNAQIQLPLEFRHSVSSTPLSMNGILSSTDIVERQRLLENSSPDGTTVSAPDPPVTSRFYPLDGPIRLSPVARSEDLSFSQPNPPISQASPTRLLAVPKLAPPADIISSSSNSRRRRPNPNELSKHSHHPSHHRRHHSQQELGASIPNASSRVLVPGTPPLQSSLRTLPTPYNGLSRQANASMEQDAIETLLFLSSPGNSGYHPNSQSQRSTIHSSQTSTDAKLRTAWNHSQTSHPINENGRSTPGLSDQTICLEAQAGDEIDRMLDQMEDSDSEDDKNFASNHSSGMSTSTRSTLL